MSTSCSPRMVAHAHMAKLFMSGHTASDIGVRVPSVMGAHIMSLQVLERYVFVIQLILQPHLLASNT